MSSSSIHQWLSLVGVIWLQSVNGANTDFPAYSSQLKHILSITQLQLNNLAFASDAGKILGWFSGVAALHLPLSIVLMIGSTLGLLGYGLQFLFLINKISSLSYWHVFILNLLAGNSTCWINTVCYLTILQNFSLDSRVAIGLSTSYIGLSAKLYTDIVNVISPSSSSSLDVNYTRAKTYLLVNSILPIMISIATVPLFMGVGGIGMKKVKRRIGRGFIIPLFIITVITGMYAVMGSFGLKKKLLTTPIVYMSGLGVLLLLAPLLIPLVLVVVKKVLQGEWSWIQRKVHDDLVMDDDQDSSRSSSSSSSKYRSGGVMININDVVEEEDDDHRIWVIEEVGVKMMTKRVEFWLYFFVYMFGATLGMVFLNNLGQIAESRGYPSSMASSLVSMSSSFGFFGRLMPSLFDYYFSNSSSSSSKYKVSTTTTSSSSFVILMAPMAASFFLLLETHTISLYMSTVIIGLCTGAITTLAVSATTELFGTKNFSINHNIIVANIPVGSFLFNYMAALVYQRKGSDQETCVGDECYRITFMIWGSISSLGTLLAFLLYCRTRKFYLQRV